MWTVELVMKMSVNISGVPLNSAEPRLDGRIVGGTETDITSHPYQVWPMCCSSIWRYFEVFEQWDSPCLYWHLRRQNILKKQKKNKVVAVCTTGDIVDWTEENWWFCSVICCFINCIAASFHIGSILRFFTANKRNKPISCRRRNQQFSKTLLS
jgi:hypothetical protein